MAWLTLLEAVELFANRLLVPLALAQPLVLDLFAKLFRVAQLARVLARLHARLFVEQRLSDLGHVRVRLDHFGKIVGRAVERQRGLFEEGLGVHRCPQRLLVAAVVVGSHKEESGGKRVSQRGSGGNSFLGGPRETRADCTNRVPERERDTQERTIRVRARGHCWRRGR